MKRQYESYKESNVQWIGKIPEHWKNVHIKRVCNKIQTGSTPPTSNSDYYKDGTIPWYSSGCYNATMFLDTPTKMINNLAYQENKLRIFPSNSIFMIGIGATIGKSALIKISASCNQQITALICSYKIFSVFLAYQLKIYEKIIPKIAQFTTLPIVDQVKIGSLQIALPAIKEQKIIVKYLDKISKSIDTTITIKQKQLKTLDALKKSIIHKAVTQGLDDSVEMKDSGVEWIGEIPEHWKGKIIKRDFKITLGKMLQSQQKNKNETEEYYLRSANIKWGGVDISDVKKMWFSPAEKKRLGLKSEDLLVSEGGDVGRSSFWKEELAECYIQNAINRIRPIPGRGSNRFLYYWLYTLKQNGYIDAIVSRITIAHLTAEKLEKLIYLSPPIREQVFIANHLDKKTAQIEKLKKNIAKQIETLELYRKSIVHECVIGKRRITKDDLKEH